MSDKAFEYAKEFTLAAIQNNFIIFEPTSKKDNNRLYAEAINEFFEIIYIKLKKLEEPKKDNQ